MHPAPVITIDEVQTENQDDPMVVEQAMVDVNYWATVVYQPRVIEAEAVELPIVVVVPFGPPLPPEMIWRCSFENLLNSPTVFEVPNPCSPSPCHMLFFQRGTGTFPSGKMIYLC